MVKVRINDKTHKATDQPSDCGKPNIMEIIPNDHANSAIQDSRKKCSDRSKKKRDTSMVVPIRLVK